MYDAGFEFERRRARTWHRPELTQNLLLSFQIRISSRSLTQVTGNRAQFTGDQSLDTHHGLAQEALTGHSGHDPSDGRRE